MATGLDRGAGTEIIRTAMFNNITNTDVTLIFGEQYHIYTILSVVVTSVGGAGSLHGYIQGYDSLGGAGPATQHLFWTGAIAQYSTWVWNDKVSFNGYQPADFGTGGIDSVSKQNALADQEGSGNTYFAAGAGSGDNMDVFVTFIDQNIGAA